MQRLGTAMKKGVFKPFFFLVVKRKTDQFHGPFATQLSGFCREDKLDELRDVVPTEGLIVVAREVKRLGDASSAQGLEECLLDFLGCQRWADREVISHYQAVVMLGQMGQSKDVEDLIGESWDDRRLRQILDRALPPSSGQY